MISGEQVYLPAFESGQSELSLVGSEFHHLIRVRRFKPNDLIWVINGRGLAALAILKDISTDTLGLEVQEEHPNRGELSNPLTLAIANLKGDHLNLVVEKATELGVSRIVPLITDHTIKKGINQARLERIAISAMKQCRRSRLPEIHELIPFKKMVQTSSTALNLFCHASEKALGLLDCQAQIKASPETVIWIGPEGDWSKDEIDLASISDYTSTGLGPRRLRAETAALHAVGLVSALL